MLSPKITDLFNDGIFNNFWCKEVVSQKDQFQETKLSEYTLSITDEVILTEEVIGDITEEVVENDIIVKSC